MDEYILLHLNRYNGLVDRFNDVTTREALINKAKGMSVDEKNTNPDVAVVARLRPLLEAELKSGFPQGVFCRPDAAGIIDAHELKRPVRGPPALPTLQVSILQAVARQKNDPSVVSRADRLPRCSLRSSK